MKVSSHRNVFCLKRLERAYKLRLYSKQYLRMTQQSSPRWLKSHYGFSLSQKRSTPSMQNITAQRKMEIIRYKFRTNNRLNLEFRSALSKLFRDYEQPVDDEILGRVTLALPDELVGLAA